MGRIIITVRLICELNLEQNKNVDKKLFTKLNVQEKIALTAKAS